MFKLTTFDSDWLRKGYINSSSSIWFETECEAQVYLDNWYTANNGYGKIEYDEWVKADKPLQEFPLKVDHTRPLIFYRSAKLRGMMY